METEITIHTNILENRLSFLEEKVQELFLIVETFNKNKTKNESIYLL